MTDRSDPGHPDVEALSECLDGLGARSAAEHVAQCAACQARVAHLRRARDAVAQPVPPLPEPRREAAVAAALAAADEWVGPVEERVAAPPPVAASRPGGTRRVRWWLGTSAAAAVLVLVVASVALLARGTRTTGTGTALGARPPDSGKQAEALEGAGDTATFGGDLGDVATVDDLRARVAVATGGRTAAAPAVGVPAAPGPSGGATGGGSAASQAPVPNVVGTGVCEEQARTLRPQLGVVVYSANLRFQGTSAVVLGFAPTPDAPPATLLVLAPEERCRLLVETGP